ncbi:ABC transporter ATP-binding protein [Phenylobacterium sp.]|uniref:ABC transporter ATP-binding protein n=1 Tax=Phenylobacterium sp. TaxID=1871053 RepID=UPI00273114F6|nr:ABC transporter ATP-binding protein [Phenylobacterium sp.]MDP1872554.1 ABC transporter ATP-binding protein [Phenylobacterium sp.]
MSELAAEDLNLTLGGKPVLAGVSATFRTGEVVAILGANGVGKSTLLSCLAGLRRPASGLCRLDGRPLGGLSAKVRAQQIGFIPQTPEIAWGLEVRTLVGLGRTPWLGARGLGVADEVAVDRALAAAHLQPLAHRDVTTLSGGERARVLIARALAGEPDWLLADEPLAGLDPRHQLDAADLFRRMAHERGCGVIITLHDLTLAARLADRIIVLVEGRVLADGPPREALTAEVLAVAYGVEASLRETDHGLTVDVVGRWG